MPSVLLARFRRAWKGIVVECGLARCRRFHLAHPLLRRIPGMYFNEAWYCSAACFKDALSSYLEEVLAARSQGKRRLSPRMPARLVLLRRGVVTEEQLAHAKATAPSAEDEDVGDVLVRLGYATDEEVARARAQEAGYGFYSGPAHVVEAALVLPSTLMRRHRAVPMHYAPAQQRLLLGFVYRVDPALVAAAEQLTGCRVEACFVTPRTYREQLARLLTAGTQPRPSAGGEAGMREVHIGGGVAPGSARAHVTEVVMRHALQNGANQMRLAITRTVAWARLRGGREDLDLILELPPPGNEAIGGLASELRRGAAPGGLETRGGLAMARAWGAAQARLKRKGEHL